MDTSISVIIPTFNRKHCISRALDSVLAQKYQNILEIIVIDDGSQDDTKSFIKDNYPSVILRSQKREGVSAARNLGIKIAKGTWLAFLDSDDSWDPQKLQIQMDVLKKSEKTFLICHTDEIWIRKGVRVNSMKKHKKSGGWIFEKCLALCAISPSSVLIHKNIFESLGVFDKNLKICEDYDMWLRITAHYPVLFIPQKLTWKYGGHPDQLSQSEYGLDRYRAKSLIKQLEDGNLSSFQERKTLEMLHKKLKVYTEGARKRGKIEEAYHYEKLLSKYK